MKKGQVEDFTDFMIAFFLLIVILTGMFLVFGDINRKVKGDIRLAKENFRFNSEMLSYLRMSVDDMEIRDVVSLSKVDGKEKRIKDFREKSSEMFNGLYGLRWSVNVVVPDKSFSDNNFKFFIGKVDNLNKIIGSYVGALIGTGVVTFGLEKIFGVIGSSGIMYFAGDDVFKKIVEKEKNVLGTCKYNILTGIVPLAYSEEKYGVVNLVLCEK